MQPSSSSSTVFDKNFDNRGVQPSSSSVIIQDKNVDFNRSIQRDGVDRTFDMSVDRRAVNIPMPQARGDFQGPFAIKVREMIKSDPVFLKFADSIDAIDCGDRVILFGVVNTSEVKTKIESSVKNLGSEKNIENRIIVK